MTYEGPKTLRGIENKMATGDGTKSWKKQANEVEEAFFGKKKKQGREKKLFGKLVKNWILRLLIWL